MKRNTLLMLTLLLFLASQLIAAPAAFASAQAEFVLINNTSQWLTLYVDGRKSCSVPPGDRCVDLIPVGNHSFKAVATDGRSASREGYIPPEGRSWTVTENQK